MATAYGVRAARHDALQDVCEPGHRISGRYVPKPLLRVSSMDRYSSRRPDVVRTLVRRDTEMRALGARIGTRQRPADLDAILFHHTQRRRVVAVLVGRLQTEVVLKEAHALGVNMAS